jgi:hypothetical protein
MKTKIALTLLVLVLLPGCFGGSKTYIRLVEPGDVVEIVDDKKVQVQVTTKDAAGKSTADVADARLTGAVAMPKSVYRKMRGAYLILVDFLNGKIDEPEMRKRLAEERKNSGTTDDKK